jgi:hypothetical protein
MWAVRGSIATPSGREVDDLAVEGVDELRGGVDARDALLTEDPLADAR